MSVAAAAGARLWVGCAGIVGLWLAAMVSDNSYLLYWGNDVIVALALGMLAWKAGAIAAPSVSVSWLTIAVGTAMLALPDIVPALGAARHVQLAPNLGAALIVYAALSLERRGTSAGDGWLKRQGDSAIRSISFVLRASGKVWLVAHLGVGVGRLTALAIPMLVASGIAGTLLHLHLERPMTEAIRRAFDRNGSRPALTG